MPIVKCPTCKSETEYSTNNPNRPFCSERCSVIDLGSWAQEQYKVAGEEIVDPQKLAELEVNQKQKSVDPVDEDEPEQHKLRE